MALNKEELEYIRMLKEGKPATTTSYYGEQASPDIVGDEDDAVTAKSEVNPAVDNSARSPSGKLALVGETTTAAGAATGNPYVGAAGLVLSTVGKVDDAKRAQEQAKIDMYNKKIMGKRAAVRNLFDV